MPSNTDTREDDGRISYRCAQCGALCFEVATATERPVIPVQALCPGCFDRLLASTAPSNTAP